MLLNAVSILLCGCKPQESNMKKMLSKDYNIPIPFEEPVVEPDADSGPTFPCYSTKNVELEKNVELDLFPTDTPTDDDYYYTYFNTLGNFLIEAQFEDVDLIHDGLAVVRTKEGKKGYINKEGKFQIPAQYFDASHFSEGLAFVSKTGAPITCIDKSGNTKFTLEQATMVYPFSDGLAKFSIDNETYGFIDKTGKVIINPRFSTVEDFAEGLAIIEEETLKGYIDKTGNTIISPQYIDAMPFSEGLAFVTTKDGTLSCIDKSGNSRFTLKGITEIYPFSDGLAKFGIINKQGLKRYGFIDMSGKIAINPEFLATGDFKNGGVWVLTPDDKISRIDKEGKSQSPVTNLDFSGYYSSFFYYDSTEFKTIEQYIQENKCEGCASISCDFIGDILIITRYDDGSQHLIYNTQTQSYFEAGFDRMYHTNVLDLASRNVGCTTNYRNPDRFVKEFIKHIGSNSFLNLSHNSTLKDVNNLYGQSRLSFNQKRAGGYSPLGETFYYFSQPITEKYDDEPYGYFNHNLYDGEYLQQSEMDKHKNKKLTTIEWHVCGSPSIAIAIRKEIEKRYGTMQNTKFTSRPYYEYSGRYTDPFNSEANLYTLFQKENLNFAIIYDDYSFSIYVGFDAKQMQEILKERKKVMEDAYPLYY